MASLATVGALIEVEPWDELQYFPFDGSAWEFIDDRTPFRFRVAGELNDDGFFFGLYGPVESGPERYTNLICNVMLRFDNSEWHNNEKCGASFKVGPSIAKRVLDYDPALRSNVPFYLHPDGTYVEGLPTMSRFGGICVVDER